MFNEVKSCTRHWRFRKASCEYSVGNLKPRCAIYAAAVCTRAPISILCGVVTDMENALVIVYEDRDTLYNGEGARFASVSSPRNPPYGFVKTSGVRVIVPLPWSEKLTSPLLHPVKLFTTSH
jgi:hypothetical protein